MRCKRDKTRPLPPGSGRGRCALLFCSAVLGGLGTLGEGLPGNVPLSLFQVSPGLEITRWAESPLLYNPTNIDIDKAGNIWVAEGRNYRGREAAPAGDRIVVLRDTDRDGEADESTVFVQEPFLAAPMGLAVLDNKVVVSMSPDLVVYTDVNRDLRFDPAVDKREVIVSGFGGRNHDQPRSSCLTQKTRNSLHCHSHTIWRGNADVRPRR